MTDDIRTDDTKQREQAFREHKQAGEHMVHRLRSWEEGDILWGWESVRPGGTTGKTYRRADAQRMQGKDFEYLDPDDSHESARGGYEAVADPHKASMGGGPDSAVFLFVARIGSVRTEPHSMQDPEPPLKFATLDKVRVLDSTYIPPEDDD